MFHSGHQRGFDKPVETNPGFPGFYGGGAVQIGRDANIEGSPVRLFRLLSHLSAKVQIVVNRLMKGLLNFAGVFPKKIDKVTNALNFPEKQFVLGAELDYSQITFIF